MSIRRSSTASTAETLERPAIVGGAVQPEDLRASVLLVEDEVLVLDLIAETLIESGFDVRTAASLGEATGVLDAQVDAIQAVITDINLGAGKRGWDVARQARELNPEIPIIYMTGDSGHEWPIHRVPKSVLLTKPFAPAQVVVAVSHLLNQANASSSSLV